VSVVATVEEWSRVAELGPFFVTSLQAEREDDAADPSWASLTTLVEDPAVLASRIAQTREALAAAAQRRPEEVEWRIAASIAHLGLAARFVAPLMGLAVTTGKVAPVGLAQASWRPILGGPYPLYFTESRHTPDSGEHASAETQLAAPPSTSDIPTISRLFATEILDGPVRQLTEAVLRSGSIASGLLWGNVVSGVGGAAKMIQMARPSLSTQATLFVDELLRHEPLLATAMRRENGQLQRRSCCLMYRLPGAGYCGDCSFSAI